MFSQIDVWFQHPFRMLVAGGRRAGKTTFTKHLLKEGNWLMHRTRQRIIWCYTKHQPDFLNELTEIEYLQGIPSKVDSMIDRNVNNPIILDDVIDEATQDRRISQLFTRGRHHLLPPKKKKNSFIKSREKPA